MYRYGYDFGQTLNYEMLEIYFFSFIFFSFDPELCKRFLNQEALWWGSLGILSQITPSDFQHKIRSKTIPSPPAAGVTGSSSGLGAEVQCTSVCRAGLTSTSC